MWLARTVSEFGSGATFAGLIVLLTRWSDSPSYVAANGLVQAAPPLLIAWLAGGVVDRYDRRRIMIACDLVRGCIIPILIFGSPDRLPMVFAVSGAQALIGSFFAPANSALLPTLVNRQDRAKVLGRFQATSLLASLLGASIGAAAAGLGSLWLVFGLDSVTFFVSAGVICLIRTTFVRYPPTTSVARSVLGGWDYLRGVPLLAAALGSAAIAIMGFGVVDVTIAPLLINTLHADPAWFGPISGSFIATAVVVGLLVGRIHRRLTELSILSAGLVLFAIGLGCMAAAPNLVVLLAAQALCGCAQPLFGTGSALLVQNLVPDRMRGRVFAISMSANQAANILGIVLVAVFAARLPVRMLLLLAAVTVLLAVAMLALARRRYPVEPRSGECVTASAAGNLHGASST